jgi:hypothetical protein
VPAQRFQTFWHGRPLSAYEQLALRSFVDHGHEIVVYSYDARLAVPPGIAVERADAVLPRDDAYVLEGYDAQGGFVAFSNEFRFALLAERGGWWVDLDVVCLRREIPDVEIFLAVEQMGGKPCEVNNAVLRFPAGHPLMARCAAASRELGARLRSRPEGVSRRDFATLGAAVLERETAALGLCAAASGPELCYPIHWSEVASLLRPREGERLAARTADAWMVHLWSSQLAALGLDRRWAPPAGSYLARLFERHGIVLPPRPLAQRLSARLGASLAAARRWRRRLRRTRRGRDGDPG